MGNSTKNLQKIVDSVITNPDLNPVLTNATGFTQEPALTVGNDVLTEMITERFNWKFNRIKLPPFYTNSYQQDYASISQKNIGWLEKATRIDIANTQTPKPAFPMRVVRENPISTVQTGFPDQVNWDYNQNLEQGQWPGANMVYNNPVGATSQMSNPPTNILDAAGNILVLTTYGITGAIPPLATPIVPATVVVPGQTVNDGTCVWTVADPNAQGLRLNPIPAQTGNLWLIRVFAQAEPVPLTTFAQTIEPIPDSYIKWFRDGFVAYLHDYSPDPKVKARYPLKQQQWVAAMLAAAKSADKEAETAGFYPTRNVLDGSNSIEIGPAWPYGPGVINL